MFDLKYTIEIDSIWLLFLNGFYFEYNYFTSIGIFEISGLNYNRFVNVIRWEKLDFNLVLVYTVDF